jgi:hypothetical protein
MFCCRLSSNDPENPNRGGWGLEFGQFPRRGSVLQPRVAVLGYPGKDGGEFPNPTGVVAKLPRVSNRISSSRFVIDD